MSNILKCSLILTGLPMIALAQSQAASRKFDVATIKPDTSGDDRFMFRNMPGGTLTVVGMPLKMLIMQAYDLRSFQVSGGPRWMVTDRWEIQAKSEGVRGRLPPAEFRPMVRALLEDRFQLKFHTETKEMPVYELMVAKNGPKFSPHVGEPARPDQRVRIGNGLLSYKQATMKPLVYQLTVQLGRMVIDKTDLQGEYDFDLKWAPEPGQGGPESIGLPPEPRSLAPAQDTTGPSLFTAIQEQLGLRLKPEKGPVPIMVVDHAEKPSEN